MDGSDGLYERALGEGVVVDRTGRGLLRLTGPQTVWFLQNTITADVEDLEPGRWRESCFLTPKGKLLSHFRVGAGPDEMWMDVDPPAGDLADWFVRYRFRTKVEIEDRSGPVSTVVGPAARDLAGDGEVRVDGETITFGSGLGDVAIADVHGRGGVPPGLERAPLGLLEVFRAEAGVARFGVDYGTEHLPQEAGLTSIVPVDKGCYVGQETVARLHFRGHVNRVVRPLRFDGPGPSGPTGRALLHDGRKVGTVTTAVVSPRLGSIGIGMVRVEPEAGSRLEVEGGGSAVVGPVPEGTKVKAG